MNLRDYLNSKKITATSFAENLNVSRVVVQKWLIGEHTPRLLHAMMIKKLTKNKVKFDDLLTKKDQTKLGEF